MAATDAQVRKLMVEYTKHGKLGRAALKAGMESDPEGPPDGVPELLHLVPMGRPLCPELPHPVSNNGLQFEFGEMQQPRGRAGGASAGRLDQSEKEVAHQILSVGVGAVGEAAGDAEKRGGDRGHGGSARNGGAEGLHGDGGHRVSIDVGGTTWLQELVGAGSALPSQLAGLFMVTAVGMVTASRPPHKTHCVAG